MRSTPGYPLSFETRARDKVCSRICFEPYRPSAPLSVKREMQHGATGDGIVAVGANAVLAAQEVERDPT